MQPLDPSILRHGQEGQGIASVTRLIPHHQSMPGLKSKRDPVLPAVDPIQIGTKGGSDLNL